MEPIDRAHIFSKGSGGCDCPPNIVMLPRYIHQILDGHITNTEVEHYKVKYAKKLAKECKNYRHKIAWSQVFGYVVKVRAAIRHQELRNRGEVSCTKKSK